MNLAAFILDSLCEIAFFLVDRRRERKSLQDYLKKGREIFTLQVCI